MLIKFIISKILLFRLLDASELLKMKAKNNVLKIGFFISKNKNNLSIIHPDIPLNDTTINVIINLQYITSIYFLSQFFQLILLKK